MKMVLKRLLLMLLMILECSVGIQAQSATEKLYVSSVFTPAHGFTSGIEGSAVDRDGILYAMNFEKQGTVGRVTSDGKGSVFITLPEGSVGNGARFDRKGNLLIADYPRHNILKVDMATKRVYVVAHEASMNQPNDIAIDDHDRLYASDPDWKNGTGNIWRIDTDGKVTLLASNTGSSNGIEVSPDNKLLYVNESVQRKVWVYDLARDGSITNRRLLIEFKDFNMDGMRCDARGNLYITRHGKGTVVKVSPEGKLLKEIQLTGKNPSNIAFGGKDGRTVYVTLQDNGNVESFRTDTPGRAWQMWKK